jgi:hypothetical protein
MGLKNTTKKGSAKGKEYIRVQKTSGNYGADMKEATQSL